MIISLKNIFEAVQIATKETYKGEGCSAYNFLYSYSKGQCTGNGFVDGWFNNADFIHSVFMSKALKSKDKRSDLFRGYGDDLFRQKYKRLLEENIIGKNCSDTVLADLSKSIEKTVSEHCAYFFYAREIGNSRFIPERPEISDLEECIKQNNIKFNNNRKRFKDKLINTISLQIDWQNVNRLFGSHLKDILDDNNIECTIKLGVITILSLIPSDEKYNTFTNDAYQELVKGFIDRIPAVHTLNRNDVWAAGKLWYEESRESESRFSEFDPIVNLFPLVDLSKMVSKDDPSEKKRDNKLLSVIRDTPGHLFLVGEGGIGKTSVLYHIMKAAYSKNSNNSKEIPLYIELSKAISKKDFDNNFDKEDQWSNYIINSIKRQLQKLPNIDTVPNEEIEKILKKYNSDEPEFVLLLDGLNEISLKSLYGSTVYLMVVNEIKCILKDWKNVRVILTSRSKDIFEDNITTLELSGIDDEYIYEYLEKTVSQSKIDFVKNNQTLLETLRVPLFLTIFAEIENVDELLSRGEILDAFFTQTKEKLYTEQSNYLRIQREHLSLQANTAITLAMASFIYDFVIPEIAWEMVQKNSFQISETRIEEKIREVLVDEAKKSPYCWAHGNDCFSEDYMGRFNESPNDVKQRFIDGFGEKKAPSIIRRFITNQLGILKPIEKLRNKHGFVHQHYRDYFAALYHIKRLKLAIYVNEDPDINNYFLAREYLSEWRKPLPSQVLIFIGEILGEVHNIPQYIKVENRWLFEPKNDCIKRGLNIFRLKDDSEKASPGDRYVVWNLFQILKLVRKDLSGEDFSNLDLSICHANGFRLGNNTYSANFDGSILTDAFFAPMGHTAPITGAYFSPDNRCILTIDMCGTINLWNAITHEVIHNLCTLDKQIITACFHPQNRVLFTASKNGSFKIWNYDEYSAKLDCTHKTGILIQSAQYSLKGETIITISEDYSVNAYDSKTFEELTHTYGNVFTNKISYVQFSPKGNFILTVSADEDDGEKLRIWSAKSNHKLICERSISNCSFIKSATFSPDEKSILLGWWHGGAQIIDVISSDPIENHNAFGSFNSLQFSPRTGSNLLASDYTGNLILYETENYKELYRIPTGYSFSQYSQDEKLIITALTAFSTNSCDAIIRDAKTLTEVPGGILKGYKERLNAAIFTPDSNHIISVSADGTTKAWAIGRSLKEVSEGAFHGYTNNLLSIHYSLYGNHIVTVSNDGILKTWDANINEETNSVNSLPYFLINSAQINPFGSQILISDREMHTLALNSKPGMASLLDESGFITGVLYEGSNELIVSAEFSHDGENIVTSLFDGSVDIINSSDFSNHKRFSGEAWTSLKKSRSGIIRAHTTTTVKYSQNDEYLILIHTENDSWFLEIRDVNSFIPVASRELEFATQNTKLSVSPKGDFLSTSHWDDNRNTGIVKLWTLDLVEVLGGTIEFSNQHIKSVQFSPNGEYLLIVTSQNDKESASVWSVKAEQSERVSVSKIQTIPNYPGLEVWNVDLQKINKHSDISNEMRKHLIEYGALINEEESQHERTINDSEKTTHRLR